VAPTAEATGPATGSATVAVPGPRRRTDATSVLAALAAATAPLRARDVTLALGLADATGNVNAVRTMLERLVKADRAQRPGRGLYAPLAG
jgi:hypothetical protein